MSIQEYANLEENFKNETLNKFIDVDKEWGPQCWDLGQYWFIKYLGIPAGVLGGCELINNMLVEPKINQLLLYFDEVPVGDMLKGDTVFWTNEYGGHIAIYDSFDGINCYYVSQNSPIGSPTSLIQLDTGNARAFRLKGVTPSPEPPTPVPTEFKVGDYVVPTVLVDYQGTPLIQYDDLYQIIDKDYRGNILGAVRGTERPIWAVLPDSNIKKAE